MKTNINKIRKSSKNSPTVKKNVKKRTSSKNKAVKPSLSGYLTIFSRKLNRIVSIVKSEFAKIGKNFEAKTKKINGKKKKKSSSLSNIFADFSRKFRSIQTNTRNWAINQKKRILLNPIFKNSRQKTVKKKNSPVKLFKKNIPLKSKKKNSFALWLLKKKNLTVRQLRKTKAFKKVNKELLRHKKSRSSLYKSYLKVQKTSLKMKKRAVLLQKKAFKFKRNLPYNIKKLKTQVKERSQTVFHSIFVKHQKLTKLSLAFIIVLFAGFYVLVLKDLPSPKMLSSAPTQLTTIIRDRNGEILYRIYNRANRVKLGWDDIPDVVKKATIAIEDAGFYSHKGFSFKSILRAFLHNMNEQESKLYHGGSTITQQLVKNRLLSPEKTYTRKIKEIVLALEAEFTFSKKEILNMYLNEVGYGGPAYGIEAASQVYFGKRAKDLNLPEAAFLAGLPAAPTTFSPFGPNPELAYDRQRQVLDRMLTLKMISQKTHNEALEYKLSFAPQRIDIKAPHWVMYVKSLLVDKLGEDRVEEGGLDVVTTLDYPTQQKAQEIVKRNIDNMGKAYNISNAATIITNPKTGEVLSMVGSADFFDLNKKGYVNVTTSLRQPGSSIKPVNYAYAFDHGYTPFSTIQDAPVVYVAKGSTEKYAPVNYDGKFHGTVTLKSALANSYNIPAVRLLNSYGVDKMIELGKQMGINSWNNIPLIGLSLTLGGAEVTMLDMARVYGTIANMGQRKELSYIKSIQDSQGNDLLALINDTPKDNKSLVQNVSATNNNRAISPIAAWWLIDILSDNIARMPAFGNYAKLSVPYHKIAVKTGTSNNFRDNWTIGFDPDYLVATWVGNNDGTFMNKNLVSGVTGAAPIWHEIMTELLKDKEPKEFEKPEGLVPVKICAVNGLLTCPNCPEEKTEFFPADKVPTKQCYFKNAQECQALKTQAEAENKSEEEKKGILAGCFFGQTGK